MVLIYASSHRHDDTYHGLCYTSRGVLAGTRNGYIFASNISCTPENAPVADKDRYQTPTIGPHCSLNNTAGSVIKERDVAPW